MLHSKFQAYEEMILRGRFFIFSLQFYGSNSMNTGAGRFEPGSPFEQTW